MEVNIETGWKRLLAEEFDKPYFHEIVSYLKKEKQLGKIIYPTGKDIFNAFSQTPPDDVKVLLLGQDPYHGPGQAHGLCFSVQEGIKPPPSLMNIYKELKNDVNKEIPSSGHLLHWAKQGILMLNASLTVEANAPMSHSKIGWHHFTDAVIKKVSDTTTNTIFILWGKFAQEKEFLIDQNKHPILKAAHPSPFSAHNGFFGCKHFSKVNELLEKQGKEAIVW